MDGGRVQDRRDDFQAAAAGGTGLHIEAENAGQEFGPAFSAGRLRRRCLGWVRMIGGGRGARRRLGNNVRTNFGVRR